MTYCDESITKNRRLSGTLINKITNDQLKKELQSALFANESINEDLIVMNEFITETKAIFWRSPYYNLILLQTIVSKIH